jgi:translation initiation factor 1 (eIF-1/SUI1)
VSRRRSPDPANPPASLGTLGDLLARRGVTARTPAAPPTPPAATPPPDVPDLARCGKVVVRRERKGHGGKTATIVAGLGLPGRDLERLARALRRALGCGASVEGDRLLVQGDQAPRVEAWLAAHGACRIVLGN